LSRGKQRLDVQGEARRAIHVSLLVQQYLITGKHVEKRGPLQDCRASFRADGFLKRPRAGTSIIQLRESDYRIKTEKYYAAILPMSDLSIAKQGL
jgi:hypothetical protein